MLGQKLSVELFDNCLKFSFHYSRLRLATVLLACARLSDSRAIYTTKNKARTVPFIRACLI